jgi:hypothetical protein
MGTKFIVNSRDTEPGDPPSLPVVTLELEESDVSYEYEVIQAIFQTVGEGYYAVLSNLGESGLKILWKGRIEDKDNRISYFTVETHLWYTAWMAIKEKPIQGAWKTCRKEDVVDPSDVKYHQ